MKFLKIVVVFLLISTLANVVFSQKDEKYREEMMRQDQERQQMQIEENGKRMRDPNFEYLESFLPSRKNSWYFSVVSSGGILGGSRLVTAINSNGNYTCGYGQDFASKFVSETDFELFSQTVQALDFAKVKTEQPKFFGCKDCLLSVLTFRNGSNSFEFTLPNDTADSKISDLYNNVIRLAGCD